MPRNIAELRECAVDRLSSMDEKQKIRAIAILGHALTVVARDAYRATGSPYNDDQCFRLLQACNEAQHRVTARINDIVDGHPWNESAFIDEVLWWGKQYGCEQSIAAAIEFMLSRRVLQ